MSKLKYFFFDIIKCLKYALFVAFILSFTITFVFLIKHKSINLWLLNDIKKYLYYCGCLLLFISVGFFMQKNSLRPLKHENDWEKAFHVLSLSFVILFTGLFICCIGMIIQFIFESLSI